MHFKRFISTPGLHPLDEMPVAPPSPCSLTIKTLAKHCQMPPVSKIITDLEKCKLFAQFAFRNAEEGL